jgi:hypothetical protein
MTSELSAPRHAYTYLRADNLRNAADLSAPRHAYTYLGADNSEGIRR